MFVIAETLFESLFFLLVAVIWIVAQVIARSRRSKPDNTQPTAPEQSKPQQRQVTKRADINDELRDFLESLAGKQAAHKPTRRPTPPAPPQTHQPVRQVQQAFSRPEQSIKPAPSAPAKKAVPPKQVQRAVKKAYTPPTPPVVVPVIRPEDQPTLSSATQRKLTIPRLTSFYFKYVSMPSLGMPGTTSHNISGKETLRPTLAGKHNLKRAMLSRIVLGPAKAIHDDYHPLGR